VAGSLKLDRPKSRSKIKGTYWSSRVGAGHEAGNLTSENSMLRNRTVDSRWII
jgi:hypothetical protein